MAAKPLSIKGTECRSSVSLVRMVHDLAEYFRGRIGYFERCETPEVLDKLENWLRRRLRSMVWKQWERGTTRYRELRERGIAAQDPRKRRVAPMDHAPCETHQRWKIALSQRLLHLARASRAHGSWLAQPPNRRMCPVVWQGRVGDHSPYTDRKPECK